MHDPIIDRILAQAEAPELLEILVERLSPTDLQSLLLEVYRRRAARLSPRDLMQQYERNRFVAPSTIAPQQLMAFDRQAFAALPPGFETLELSPVCPLGTSSVVATVDQNKVITTIRNTDVTADATNVLALECARRRRGRAAATTRLCASHRVIRAQVFGGAASFPHFRLLSLCTAGRDSGSYHFEIAALIEHIAYYLRLLDTLRQAGAAVGDVRVSLTAFDATRHDMLATAVVAPLAAQHPGVGFTIDQQRETGRGYYTSAGFHIYARAASGDEFFLIDGGFTDWTQQILSNRKERLLISGMGSERFVVCFGGGAEA